MNETQYTMLLLFVPAAMFYAWLALSKVGSTRTTAVIPTAPRDLLTWLDTVDDDGWSECPCGSDLGIVADDKVGVPGYHTPVGDLMLRFRAHMDPSLDPFGDYTAVQNYRLKFALLDWLEAVARFYAMFATIKAFEARFREDSLTTKNPDWRPSDREIEEFNLVSEELKAAQQRATDAITQVMAEAQKALYADYLKDWVVCRLCNLTSRRACHSSAVAQLIEGDTKRVFVGAFSAFMREWMAPIESAFEMGDPHDQMDVFASQWEFLLHYLPFGQEEE